MSDGKLRWLKWWPQDDARDPALRMCGLAARGLWREMLALAHDAEPYGHVLVHGRNPTMRQLASIVSAPEREVVKLVAELEEAGVFSRTEEGVIYCRRMVRDNAAREKAREYGRSGGNPSLKPQPKAPDNGGVNPPLKLQEAEAKRLEEETSSLRSEGGPSPAERLPPDAKAILWTEGLSRLKRITGKGDSAARGLLGRLCRDAHDDCALVSSLLHQAEADRVGDPIPWLTKAIQTRTGATAGRPGRKPMFPDFMFEGGHGLEPEFIDSTAEVIQ